jgi:predicted permease
MQVRLVTFVQDLRVALRGFRRAPGFAITAVLAIAIGVGAATAVFSVVDRILFRPLPYPHDEQLVSLGFTAPIEQQEFMLGSDYYEWRDEHGAFQSMTSWSGIVDCDLGGERPERISCARVEANFLHVLGVRPVVGRNFKNDEDLPNGPRAALLTYNLWRARFSADSHIVGRHVRVDGELRTIVGVLPQSFELPTLNKADMLIPQALNPAGQHRPNTGAVLRAFGRLKPGVTIQQAEAALAPYFARTVQFVPAPFRKEVHLRVRPLRDRQIQDARFASWMLLGAVAAVLLIGCANVANLLLARSAERLRETAIRLALGASRARIVAQALTESVLLGLMGGTAGCALAWLLVRVLTSVAPNGILRLGQASLDGRVLAAALTMAVLSGILSGLVPTFARLRADDLSVARVIGSRRRRLGPAIVAVQIAFCVVLLSGAGILLRSLWKLEAAPLGIEPAHVSAVPLVLGTDEYTRPEERVAFFSEAERRVQQIPGVESAAVSDSIPPSGQTHTMIYTLVDVEGRPSPPEGTGGMVVWRAVTPRFFETLRVPIVRGRSFDESDRQPHANTVILGEPLARRLFPGQDALGQHLRFGHRGSWCTVIGIAGPLKNAGLDGRDDPEYYVPRTNADPGRRGFLVVRSRLAAETLAARVREQIAAIDPALPVDVEPMERRIYQLAARPRFNAVVLVCFAVFGVLLAAIGLHGLMSFVVAQRRREIGVRMALGATRKQVVATVLSEAARWTVAGSVAGIAASLPLPRLLRLILFDAPRLDSAALATATGILFAVALSAVCVPLWRAASVDPAQALRDE